MAQQFDYIIQCTKKKNLENKTDTKRPIKRINHSSKIKTIHRT